MACGVGIWDVGLSLSACLLSSTVGTYLISDTGMGGRIHPALHSRQKPQREKSEKERETDWEVRLPLSVSCSNFRLPLFTLCPLVLFFFPKRRSRYVFSYRRDWDKVEVTCMMWNPSWMVMMDKLLVQLDSYVVRY